MPGPAQKVSAEQKPPEREKKAPKSSAPETGQRVVELQEQISRDLRETTKVQNITQPHSYLDSVLNQLEVILPKDKVEDLKKVAARFLAGDRNKSAEALLIESRAELRKSSQADLITSSDDDVPPEQKELLKKIREAMYSYVSSGTDYSMASGRVWATRNRCAELMPYLFSTFEELTKEHPELIGSGHFRYQLESIRAEMGLQQAYVDFQKLYLKREAGLKALARRNINVVLSSPDTLEVVIAKDLEVHAFANCLFAALNGKESYSNDHLLNPIYAEIAKANPGLSGIFENLQTNEKRSIPAGSHLEVANTEPGRILASRELQRAVTLIDLLLVTRSGTSNPTAKISLESEEVLKKLKSTLAPAIQEMLDDKNKFVFPEILHDLAKDNLFLLLTNAKAGSSAEEFLTSLIPHLEALCRKGNTKSQEFKAEQEIEIANILYKRCSDQIASYDPTAVQWEKFLEEFKKSIREIQQEPKLSRGTCQSILQKLNTLLEQRLLSFVHQAATTSAQKAQMYNDQVSFSWNVDGGFYQFKSLLEQPLKEVETVWGLDLSDPHFQAELEKSKAVFRHYRLQQTLEVISAETTTFFDNLRDQGFEINKETILELPTVSLTQEMSLLEVATRFFSVQGDQPGDFVPTQIHYQLLEQANPDLAEIFEQARERGFSEVRVPRGAILSIKTTAQGLICQQKIINEMVLHHKFVLAEVDAEMHPLSQNAQALARERIQTLEHVLKVLEPKLLVARAAQATARALGTFQAKAEMYAREPADNEFNVHTILKSHFASAYETIDTVANAPVTKDLAPELRLQCTLYQQQAAVAFGLALLGANRGEHARQAFERALNISEQVLTTESTLSNEQKEKLCIFRSELYRRVGLTYLHETRLSEFLKLGTPNLETDATANWMFDHCVSGISEALEKAQVELHRAKAYVSGSTEHIEAGLKSARIERHRLHADLFGVVAKPLQRYQHLSSALAIQLGHPTYEFTLFEPDSELNIDENTGRLTASWYGTDSFPALSQQRLGTIVSDILKLQGAAKEQAQSYLLMMAQCALEVDDAQQSIGRAMAVNQILSELSVKDNKNEHLFFMRMLVQAQVSFRFGQAGDHQEAMRYATRQLEALEPYAQDKKRPISQALLSLRDSQLLRFRMELAQSDKDRSGDYVQAIERQRVEQKNQDEVRIAQIDQELEAIRGKFQETFEKENRNPAQHVISRFKLLNDEREARINSQATLMLQEALVNLYSNNSERSKQILEELRSQYGDRIDWVRPRVAKILQNNDKGSLTAAVQTALNEINTESFEEFATVSLLTTGGGVGVGFLIGNVPGAIIGGLIGLASGTAGLKARNLYRGWGRISQSYTSGLSSLSGQDTLLDALFLAVDIATIAAPIKGGGVLLKGASREALELATAETKALWKKKGLEITEEQAKKLAWDSVKKQAANEATGFGGRWVTFLSVSTFAAPVSLQLYDVYNNPNLSEAQKQAFYQKIGNQAAKAGMFMAVMWGGQYTLLRFSNRPSKLARELSAELERVAKSAAKAPEIAAVEIPKVAPVETPQAKRPETPQPIERPKGIEDTRLAKIAAQIKEIGERLAQGVDEGIERLLKAQKKELEEMAGEMAPSNGPVPVNESYLRPISFSEMNKAQRLLDTMSSQLEDLKVCAELEGDFGKVNDVDARAQRVKDLSEYLDQLREQRGPTIHDDTIPVESEIRDLLKTIDSELDELRDFSSDFHRPSSDEGGYDSWTPSSGDEPFGAGGGGSGRGGGQGRGSGGKGLNVIDSPRTLLRAGNELIRTIDQWLMARAENAEKITLSKRAQTSPLQVPEAKMPDDSGRIKVEVEIKPQEFVRVEIEPETIPMKVELEPVLIPQEMVRPAESVPIRVAPPMMPMEPAPLDIDLPMPEPAQKISVVEPEIKIKPNIGTLPRAPLEEIVEAPKIVRIDIEPETSPFIIEPEVIPFHPEEIRTATPSPISIPAPRPLELAPLEVRVALPEEELIQTKLDPEEAIKAEIKLQPKAQPSPKTESETQTKTKTKTKKDIDTWDFYFEAPPFEYKLKKIPQPAQKETKLENKSTRPEKRKVSKEKKHSRKETPVKQRSAIGAEEYDRKLQQLGAPERVLWVKKESDY